MLPIAPHTDGRPGENRTPQHKDLESSSPPWNIRAYTETIRIVKDQGAFKLRELGAINCTNLVDADGIEPPSPRLQRGANPSQLHVLGGTGLDRTTIYWIMSPEFYP